MATELQTAYQVTPPTGAFDGHLLVILAIMVTAGALGGAANYFLSDRQADPVPHPRGWLRYPVLGVVAALTVPLFLNMISSTLLEGARTRPLDFFVFAGFCLIYVVASRRLFENIALRLLAQFDQVKKEMGELRELQSQQEEAVLALREEKPETRNEPRESLTYNDVEILRVLSEESVVYGNLAALCDKTGLARELASQRLTVMKNLGVIETRINDKNVLHWGVSARGRQILGEILAGQEDKQAA